MEDEVDRLSFDGISSSDDEKLHEEEKQKCCSSSCTEEKSSLKAKVSTLANQLYMVNHELDITVDHNRAMSIREIFRSGQTSREVSEKTEAIVCARARKIATISTLENTLESNEKLAKIGITFIKEEELGEKRQSLKVSIGDKAMIFKTTFKETDVAIKVYRASRISYIAKEYQILHLIDGHMSIPHAYGITNTGLVLSLVKGDRLKEYTFTNEEMLARFILRLIDAVSHIHHRGIIHNNLNNDHIIVSNDTGGALLPVITGFGNACLVEDGFEIPTSRISEFGDHCFLPKKVIKGEKKLSIQSDLYCIGVIISRLTCLLRSKSKNSNVFARNVYDWLDNFASLCLDANKSAKLGHQALLEQTATLAEILTIYC